MNRISPVLILKRQMTTFKIPSLAVARETSTRISNAINLDEQISKANELKEEFVDLSLDQYINFVNKTSSKIRNIQVPTGKKLTVTTSLNIGMMGITTVIEDKE